MKSAELDWDSVWAGTAARLADHCTGGRRRLLTEDTVRMCLVIELQSAGVDPARLALEVPAAELGGGKIDLTIDGAAGVVIELKYPRDSRTGFSPDTMTLGELIRDFLRVAVLPAADRWVVQVLNDRLLRYLSNIAGRHDVRWVTAPGDTLTLGREALEGLPKTAVGAIGATRWMLPVTARCTCAVPVADGLTMYAYRVDAPESGSRRVVLVGRPAAELRSTGPLAKEARAEILDAIGRLTTRSGRSTVAVAEVVDEVRRSGSTYAESTIRTMLTSHMCAQVHGPNIGAYNDVDRVGRGTYRRREAPS